MAAGKTGPTATEVDLQRDATLSLYKSGSVYMLGLQYCTRGRAARAGVDHTAGGMAEAPAHTEELLDRRAVELSGCHGPQGAEDFVKSMKAGGLGGHGGIFCSTTC